MELFIAVAAIAVGIAVMGYIYSNKFKPAEERHLDEDWDTPLKRWSRGAFSIVTRNFDYAYRPAWTRLVNNNSWQIRNRTDLDETLVKLDGAHAWPLIRQIVVCRLAVGLDLLTDEESWRRIRPIARDLQSRYESWDAMADAYLAGRRHWKHLALDGSEDDLSMRQMIQTIAGLRESLWPLIPFHTDLSEEAELAEISGTPRAEPRKKTAA